MTTPSRSPRVIITPDSFKGTIAAPDAAAALAAGFTAVLPDADVLLAPMADGGEGTAATFSGETVTLPTTDAAGRLTEASYQWDAANATAYIDVAAASGLPAVATHPVPTTGDTYGTGVLIADAVSRGATTITLGLGGSATTDGGAGILVALSAIPTDKDGYPLRPGGAELVRLDHFNTAELNIAAAAVDWVLLTDVRSPATGPTGSAAVFAPQKGANPQQVALLEGAITRLCEVCDIDPQQPGLGAAGALPVGITWLSRLVHGDTSHVHLLPGAPTVARAHGLPDEISQADLVITGEGSLDGQSFLGKVVGTVVQFAQEGAIPVFVAAGRDSGESPTTAAPLEVLTLLPQEEASPVEQMHDAGRRIARAYLEMCTAQG